MQQVFLGIDTSCYTTSVAILDSEGSLLADRRILLKVKESGRGLRQSEMVFQHVKNLPVLVEEVFANKALSLTAIGVSSQPRPLEGSYMPAFMSGTAVARSLAAATGATIITSSHQENHIQAGLWSTNERPGAGSFIVLHASGGTTDLLLVEKKEETCLLKELGGTGDINAGQFIDRMGVAMGLPFPCGDRLEELAATAGEAEVLPVAVNGFSISYSGPLTAALKLLDKGADRAALAAGVQVAVAKSLAKLLKNAAEKTACASVLLVGGVTANCYIRDFLTKNLSAVGVETVFPQQAFCGDNAVGCAYMALKSWRVRHG